MKNLIKKILLILLTTLAINLRAQSTDFTMSSNQWCDSVSIVTIEVYDNSTPPVLLWSGTPFTGTQCITGGTPAFVRIIDPDPSCANYPLPTFQDIPVNTLVQNVSLCAVGTCLNMDTSPIPPDSYFFYAGYITSGGNCATPFVSGLLTLTLYPRVWP